MLTEEQCAELEAKARNSRDNARAEELVVEAFMPEYRKGLSGHPEACQATHDRSMELYDFAVKGGHRARDFIKNAQLYEAAAAMGRAALSNGDRGSAA